MGAVEDSLFQIHKSAEKDSFNYGGRLNDMFIALHDYVEQGGCCSDRVDAGSV